MQGNLKRFGEFLEEQRKKLGMSKTDLAKRTALTPGYISHLTRGERTSPSVYVVQALADVLELDAKTRKLFFEAAGHADYAFSKVPSSLSDEPRDLQPIAQKAGEELQQLSRGWQDWGEAPNTHVFYGRKADLATLEKWIVADRCQMVAVLGMGGVGKTLLTAKVAEQLKDQFEYVFWRSLQSAPPLEDILEECLQFFAQKQHIDPPGDREDQIRQLLAHVRNYRSLIVLDNVESVLEGGQHAGRYRDGYEAYGRLFQLLGETKHQSCLVLTSREKPKEIVRLEGRKQLVRPMQLAGMSVQEGREILRERGLEGPNASWEELVALYAGNPLALKLASEPIREVFGGDIAAFLRKGEVIFDDIHDLLVQHFSRLSTLEQDIMFWLAIGREPTSLESLQEDFFCKTTESDALTPALASLRRRYLVEMVDRAQFSLQPVIMEYVLDELIERVCKEIETQTITLFGSHALIKAQSKDYVRESQIRLVLKPIAERLQSRMGEAESKRKIRDIVSQLRETPRQGSGYAAGNVLNLLAHMRDDLRGMDFSHLTIWQAFLQKVALPAVNFTGADLERSVFTDNFGSILCVAFSPNGEYFAAGSTNGLIRLWHTASGKPLLSCQGHENWVRAITISPDGYTLVSGGDDQTIRFWETSTGKCFRILREHTNRVRSLLFSSDGSTLISGSDDKTIRFWEMSTGYCWRALSAHTDRIRSIALSPNGTILASGSDDQTIRLWKTSTGDCLHTLQGHTGRVRSVAFSPDGNVLASGSDDRTIRLWEMSTGRCSHILEGHSSTVRSVAFSRDKHTLISCSDDQTLRLWETSTGGCLHVLVGHSNAVRSVGINPNGNALVSGSDDQTVRLWESHDGHWRCMRTLQGYNTFVYSVTFSPNGQLLASGGHDHMVRLWESETGRCLKTLSEHAGLVYSVAFSPDGRQLVSGSYDHTVRLWDTSTGVCLKTFRGHSNQVNAVAFSPDGALLASGSEDNTVRLWEMNAGSSFALHGHASRVRSVTFSPDGALVASGSEDTTVRLWKVETRGCLMILQGHTNQVRAVAFSLDGVLVASGSEDATVRLWEVGTGRCLITMQGHTNRVRAIAFSADGSLVASGSEDSTVRLWEVKTGRCLLILSGHAGLVYSVAFHPDGEMVASGSYDGTIKLWDTRTGECQQTLRGERPYEGMNIAEVRGINSPQRRILKLLGAID